MGLTLANFANLEADSTTNSHILNKIAPSKIQKLKNIKKVNLGGWRRCQFAFENDLMKIWQRRTDFSRRSGPSPASIKSVGVPNKRESSTLNFFFVS